MAKIKTAADGVKKEKKPIDFMGFMCGLWILAIMGIMPLFATDAYARILKDKYIFTLVSNCIVIVAFIIWILFDNRIKNYFDLMKSYADTESGKWFWNWFKATFNVLDICMLVFLLMTILSTLLASPYVYQAFFGNEGRNMGTITIVPMCLTFFIISRHMNFKEKYITIFLVSSLLMAIWAITDYFRVDLLRFKYYISPENYNIFVSSIGNIDSYNAYMALPLGFAGWLFIDSGYKPFGRKMFFAICFFAVVTSIITSNADNGYLAMITFFALTPLFALKTRDKAKRYLITLALFTTALSLASYWNTTLGDAVVTVWDGFLPVIQKLPMKWISLLLWIIIIAFYVYDMKVSKVSEDTLLPKALTKIWGVLLIIGAAIVIVICVIANTNQELLPAWMEPFKVYLIFNDSWGYYRALVWKLFIELYGRLPLVHQIFGTGPETASIYLFNEYYWEIAEKSGLIFDSPHNELLQVFFNMGPIGLISYVGALVSPLILASKAKLKKYYPVILAVAFASLCHLVECVVTLVVPMDIPVLFALLAIACNLYRNKEA